MGRRGHGISDTTPGSSSLAAARGLGYNGLLAAMVAGGTTLLPLPDGYRVPEARLVLVITAAASLTMFLPAWGRLPYRATLVMGGLGICLIAAYNVFAAADPWRYGTCVLLLFVWVGMYHAPGTALACAPLAALAYVVPLLVARPPGAGVGVLSVASAIPLCVIMGEVIARRTAALDEARRRLDRLAHRDSLTDLPNRRAFLAAVDAVAIDAVEAGCAVAFIDLDRFKAVNDGLGHGTGDLLLRATAEGLLEVLRPQDLVARLAGDEFGVLMRDITPTEAEDVAHRLRAVVDQVAAELAPGLGVAASVGVAWLSTGGADDVLARADEAMYAEKRSRRTVTVDAIQGPVQSVRDIPPSTDRVVPVT